jgi:hypothetical protein
MQQQVGNAQRVVVSVSRQHHVLLVSQDFTITLQGSSARVVPMIATPVLVMEVVSLATRLPTLDSSMVQDAFLWLDISRAI